MERDARRELIRARFREMAGEAGAQDWPMGDVMALGVYCAAFPELRVSAEERKEQRRLAREQRKAAEAQQARTGFRDWSTNYALGQPVREMDVEWVKAPNPKPKYQVVRVNRRRKGRHALTEIGEKAGVKKLPKLARKYAWQAS